MLAEPVFLGNKSYERPAPLDDLHALDKPFSVIYDPLTRRGAAYDALNRLITSQASPELIMYAISLHHRQEPWDEPMWAISGVWRDLPEWLQDAGVRARCIVCYCRHGRETVDELLRIPSV